MRGEKQETGGEKQERKGEQRRETGDSRRRKTRERRGEKQERREGEKQERSVQCISAVVHEEDIHDTTECKVGTLFLILFSHPFAVHY